MEVRSTFKIRRYWLRLDTPSDVLDTLNYKDGVLDRMPRFYVDIEYFGDSDKNLTFMELRYGEHVHSRTELTYTLAGDDGLDNGLPSTK